MDEDERASGGLYQLIFDRIVHGHYPPGIWLREEALASQFGVSRTPVRNALYELAQDGLVEMIPKRGCRCVGLTIDDIDEAYAIRRSLELLALERALPTLSLTTLSQMRRTIEALSEDEDSHLHAEIDTGFHTFIMTAAGGQRLTRMLTSLYRIMASFRELAFERAEVRRGARVEHLAIIDYLLVRDLDGAARALGDHIDTTRGRILTDIARGSSPP